MLSISPGFFFDSTQFAYSWLLSLMFFLSFSLGAMFLVLAHHLFDAGWSVPIRRVCENIALLFTPWLALLFLPIGLLAPKLYKWWSEQSLIYQVVNSVKAKLPIFTHVGFWGVSIFCFLVWGWLSRRLRYHPEIVRDSDKPGSKPSGISVEAPDLLRLGDGERSEGDGNSLAHSRAPFAKGAGERSGWASSE